MSTIQAIHHVEQMQAARIEFAEFWRQESKRTFIQKVGRDARVEFEITAWNAFIAAKGLK